METTVLLVDDHPVFRKGLRLLLEEEGDMRVVGEAGDGQTAIEQVRELNPDVVIMDITMPKLNGVDATRHILAESPDARIIALSIHGEKRFIEQMLQVGAAGYILKSSIPEELVNGVRAVVRGEVYLSAAVAGVVVSEYRKALSGDPTFEEQDDRTATSLIGATKLHRPPVSADILPRARLVDLLEAGRHRPLTLISAAAGYGKSTLASQWLETIDCPSAWVSLDEHDSDLRLFLTYLLAAIQNLHPGLNLKTQSLLGAPNLPPVPLLARYLLNDLDQVDEPFILVLDDYHHIIETAVHDLLTELLRHPSPILHLALVTRRDPPLPTSALRGQGRLTEISMEHLCFTPAETSAFLERALGVSVDEETAAALEQKVEGWVTGLRLIALSVGQDKDVGRILRGLEKAPYYVNQYLMREVLLQVPLARARYLLETSILDRFCAPLCEAVHGTSSELVETDDKSGRAFIEWLEKMHLFVIALDATHQWFRYHHLFQQLLLDQLKRDRSPEDVARLHARASRWLAENELIDEALQHALAAEDFSYAVHLVEQHRYDLMNTEQWQRLERWLQQLPPEIVDENPKLLTTKAWSSLVYHSRWSESLKAPDQIEESLLETYPESPERSMIVGEIDALRTTQLYSAGEIDRAITTAERALGALHAQAHSMRGQTVLILAMAYQARGELDRAQKIIHDMLDRYSLSGGVLSTKLLMGLCVIHWLEGNITGMKEPALQLLRLGEEFSLPESASFGRYFLGSLHYVRNELAEAEPHFAAVVTDRYLARAHYYAHCAFGQALCFTAWGRTDEACQVAESVLEYVLETGNRWLVQIVQVFQLELALRQDRIAEILPLAQRVFHDLFGTMYVFYIPQLTEVKVLLKQNTPGSRQEAAALLDNLYDVVVSTHNTRVRIDVLALQALLHDAQGEEPAALEKLTESLALAEPGGFIRNFVDLGPPMADLLTRLKKQDVATDYVEQILAAFPTPQPALRSAGGPAVSSTPQAELVEPLTKRELQTLRLLATELSVEEIAAEMVVAVTTVRTHTKRIYGKLGVHSRFEAVQRARDLGLL